MLKVLLMGVNSPDVSSETALMERNAVICLINALKLVQGDRRLLKKQNEIYVDAVNAKVLLVSMWCINDPLSTLVCSLPHLGLFRQHLGSIPY